MTLFPDPELHRSSADSLVPGLAKLSDYCKFAAQLTDPGWRRPAGGPRAQNEVALFWTEGLFSQPRVGASQVEMFLRVCWRHEAGMRDFGLRRRML